MTFVNPLDELSSSTGKAFFNRDSQVGASVTGTILSADPRQVTDFQTGKPKTWDDGKPQQQVVISIQTDLRDDADDEGERSLYVKTWGSQWRALQDAVRTLGVSKLSEALAPGNVITQTFTGTKRSGNGFDEKLYSFALKRGASPALDTVAAAPSDPWNQPPAATVQPAAAPPATPTPVALLSDPPNALALIQAGLTDDQIRAQIPGIDTNVLAMLRAQA